MKVEISRDEALQINRWANATSVWVRSEPFGYGDTEEGQVLVALYAGIAVKMARVISKGKAKNDAG
jgi:hypothetical protein